MSQTRLLGFSMGTGVAIGMALGFFAARTQYHPPGPPSPHHPPWSKQLDLSDAQQESIHKIFERAHDQDHDLFKKMKEASEELKKSLQDPKATDDQLQQGFDKVNQLRTEAGKRRFLIDLQVRKVVGPEKMKNFDPMGPPGPPMMGGPGGPPPMGGPMGGPPPPPPDGEEGFPPPPPPPPDNR